MITINISIDGVEHKVRINPDSKSVTKNTHWIDNNPLVYFFYPEHGVDPLRTHRMVRLISVNEKYLFGLEINDQNRTKKFVRAKVHDFRLKEFNPAALDPTKKTKI